MTFCKTIFLVLLSLVGATFCFAQITVSSGDLLTSGTYTFGTTDGLVAFSAGGSGANQTWNFTNSTWAGTYTDTYLPPSSTPMGASFPTATRCIFTSGYNQSDTYQYERIASNGVFFLGTATADTAMPLTNESQFAPLPYTYPNSWTIVVRETTLYPPGIIVTMVDSITQTCVGWGSIVTPYGTHSCLKIFGHAWVTFLMSGIPISSFQFVSYSWVNQQGNEVLTAQSDTDVTDPNFTSAQIDMLQGMAAAEPERGPVARGFKVEQNYPNPFNPNTTLPLTLDKTSEVQIQIYDETGRLVSNRSLVLPAGHQELPIDGSNWSTGTYFARVSTPEQSQTTKMMLVK